MIKNLLRLAIVIVIGIMSFVVGQTVWFRVAPKQTLPAPVAIRETKPEARRFLPDAVVSGIVEKGMLQRGNENWPLSGKDVYIGNIYTRDDVTGFGPISPGRVKDGQRIFIDFYKNKKLDLVVGKVKTYKDRYITYVNDSSNEKYFLSYKSKFLVADPTGTFWRWGYKPDKIKVGDIVEVGKDTYTYIAPLLGSATGIIKITARGDFWVRFEVAEEKIPIVVNKGTRLSRGKITDLKDGTKIYVLYWFDGGNLIAHSININP
ncbi:hypothetical protein HZB69_03200 [Candidatus Amesbacteria bacterium]|nr:hypothetical protein [Candidatus Amesbacteria bacterium]